MPDPPGPPTFSAVPRPSAPSCAAWTAPCTLGPTPHQTADAAAAALDDSARKGRRLRRAAEDLAAALTRAAR